MDVVLDSNAYSSDYGMRSARFLALYSFLKKTAGRLILFKLVHDEVLANYKRDFDEKVRPRWDKMRAYAVEESTFRFPDFESQLKAVRTRLSSPEGIETLFVDKYDGINIEEVVRRGIERVPPASSRGEELRDVVLWLAIIAHAKGQKEEIAFVTADSGFWAEDTDEPRGQILKDISEAAVAVRLYRSLDAFLAQNVLPEKKLSSDRALAIFTSANIGDFIISKVVATEFPNSTILSSSIAKTDFEGGSLYEVGGDSEFVECGFTITAKAQIKGTPWFESFVMTNPKLDHETWADLADFVVRDEGKLQFYELKGSHSQDWENWKTNIYSLATTTRSMKFEASAKLSIRLLHGSVAGVTIDSLRMSNLEFDATGTSTEIVS